MAVYQYKREPLAQDEADALANTCRTARERLVVWLLLDTGLRASELVSLARESIQWQEQRLMVYGKGGPDGPRSKRRIMPLSNRVWPLVEAHFALHDRVGLSQRTLQREIKAVANRAGIRRPVSAHVLRHTFSVTALRKGLSLRTLQHLLGHNRLETTAIYLNLSPENVVREFREKW